MIYLVELFLSDFIRFVSNNNKHLMIFFRSFVVEEFLCPMGCDNYQKFRVPLHGTSYFQIPFKKSTVY